MTDTHWGILLLIVGSALIILGLTYRVIAWNRLRARSDAAFAEGRYKEAIAMISETALFPVWLSLLNMATLAGGSAMVGIGLNYLFG